MKLTQIIIGVLIGIAFMAAVWYIVTPSGKVSREGFQQPANPVTTTPPAENNSGGNPLLQTCSIMKSIYEQVKANYEKAKSSGNLPENIARLQSVMDTMSAELAKNNCN